MEICSSKDFSLTPGEEVCQNLASAINTHVGPIEVDSSKVMFTLVELYKNDFKKFCKVLYDAMIELDNVSLTEFLFYLLKFSKESNLDKEIIKFFEKLNSNRNIYEELLNMKSDARERIHIHHGDICAGFVHFLIIGLVSFFISRDINISLGLAVASFGGYEVYCNFRNKNKNFDKFKKLMEKVKNSL